MENVLMMPEEYIGAARTKTQWTHSTPRKWTEKEIEWVLALQNKDYNAVQIACSVQRNIVSVSTKLKRLKKKDDTYNDVHREEKYRLNEEYLLHLQPDTVLDVFCGAGDYYKDYHRVTNDINPDINADYHEDALKFMCQMYLSGQKFDLIDLDPFGSAYDCFDLALKMAKKGIVITFGEMGHKRWKRFDFVRSRYGINVLEDFTIDKMIAEVQRIARNNHKSLTVFRVANWQNISRVWFNIDNLKITEQWK